ncbi:MAG: type II toxin-antitoxin system RelE/ParE family toxin [Treponema sp.]|jgi:hypothetical protein|nr:type II toxin-antitoxin system RelE/ParE family toxin [Treponema sp.]
MFIYTKKFDREWADQNLTNEDQHQLENFLLVNPVAGKMMEGTGGLRKVRWNSEGSGKSGGVRILYIDMPATQIICMVDLFPKNEKDNLTKDEKNKIKRVVKQIVEELGQ